MSNAPDDLRSLWQSMPTAPVTITAEEMRARATKFGGKIRRRNIIEYIASVFVIAIFGWYATWPEPATPLWPIANVMIIIGTLVMVWNLRRIGVTTTAPESAPVGSLIEFHRADLVRHQKSLTSVWLWYLMPFVPGLLLWNVAVATSPPDDADPNAWFIGFAVSTAITAAIYLGIVLVNLRGAARLQSMIDDLDRFGDQ